MHLVNILRIITFSFLVGHSILTISDFNSFRFFWDTLYIEFTALYLPLSCFLVAGDTLTKTYSCISVNIKDFDIISNKIKISEADI